MQLPEGMKNILIRETISTLRLSQTFEDSKHKSELCKAAFVSGKKKCRFQSSCDFAHNIQELRPRVFDFMNYKKQDCSKWGKACQYGTRCLYLHDEEIWTLSERLQLLYSFQEHKFRIIHDQGNGTVCAFTLHSKSKISDKSGAHLLYMLWQYVQNNQCDLPHIRKLQFEKWTITQKLGKGVASKVIRKGLKNKLNSSLNTRKKEGHKQKQSPNNSNPRRHVSTFKPKSNAIPFEPQSAREGKLINQQIATYTPEYEFGQFDSEQYPDRSYTPNNPYYPEEHMSPYNQYHNMHADHLPMYPKQPLPHLCRNHIRSPDNRNRISPPRSPYSDDRERQENISHQPRPSRRPLSETNRNIEKRQVGEKNETYHRKMNRDGHTSNYPQRDSPHYNDPHQEHPYSPQPAYHQEDHRPHNYPYHNDNYYGDSTPSASFPYNHQYDYPYPTDAAVNDIPPHYQQKPREIYSPNNPYVGSSHDYYQDGRRGNDYHYPRGSLTDGYRPNAHRPQKSSRHPIMTDHYGDHYASKIPENGVLMPPSPPLMETPQKVGSPAVSASMYCSSPVLSLYEEETLEQVRKEVIRRMEAKQPKLNMITDGMERLSIVQNNPRSAEGTGLRKNSEYQKEKYRVANMDDEKEQSGASDEMMIITDSSMPWMKELVEMPARIQFCS